ncbi:MAG: FapA family protein [Fibrobacterales bacterium]
MADEILQFKISEDEYSVMLASLYPEVTLSLIREELALLGVTEGIQIAAIEEAIKSCSGGGTVQNLIVARAGVFGLEIGYIPKGEKIGYTELQDYAKTFKSLFSSLNNREVVKPSASKLYDNLLFLAQGQAVFRVAKTMKNVRGVEIDVDPDSDIISLDESIVVEDKGTFYEWSAGEAGYLVCNLHNELALFSPYNPNSDKTQLFFLVEPVSVGAKEQQLALSEYLDEKLIKKRGLTLQEVLNNPKGDLLIRKQIDVIPGRNAELEILVEKKRVEVKENEQVDHKAVSSFLHVKEGIAIAKKIQPKEGKAGIDIWMESIPVEPIKDDDFIVGDFIESTEKEGEIEYCTTVEGVLYVNGKTLMVSEGLIIEGDVNAETGNVRYDKDIVVEGSVLEGFSVESGGNISIQGSVANNARIDARKNLEVLKGVFGEATSIYVKGNAEIGFVQESMVRIEGDCLIDRFLYQARVFVGREITVLGNKVKVQKKGAVIGGVTNAVHGMTLHSAGSIATKTELIAGIDIRLLEQIKELEGAQEVLAQSIVQLEARVGMDLARNDSVEHLRTLGEADKAKMKEKLVALKESMDKREKVGKALEQLKERSKGMIAESPFIEVKTKVIPDLLIRLGSSFKEIKEELNGIKFRGLHKEILEEKDGALIREDGTIVSTEKHKKTEE